MGTVCLNDPSCLEAASSMESPRRPHVFTRIRETWLTRAPSPNAALTAGLAVLALAIGSLLAWNGTWHADQWMPASGGEVFGKGEYWRLWTTLFTHADIGHLLSNSLLFFVLGALLAGYFGPLVFPFAAFVLGGMVNAAILTTYDPETHLIGASGVVFLMGGVWLTLYFLLHRERSLWQRTLRAGGVALALFMPAETFDPAISYRTHFLGFAVGVAFALMYFVWKKNEFRAAEVRELVVEDDEDLDAVPLEEMN